MPIIIDTQTGITQTTDAKGKVKNVYSGCTPKFFNEKLLTGNGSKTGLLNETKNPAYYPDGYPIGINPNLCVSKYENNGVTEYNVPLFMLEPELLELIEEIPMPDLSDMTHVADCGNNEIYIWCPIKSIRVDETHVDGPYGASQKQLSRTFSASFNCFTFNVIKPNNKTAARSNVMCLNGTCNYFSMQPDIQDLHIFINNLKNNLQQNHYTIRPELDAFIDNYSIYDAVCEASERWQKKSGMIVELGIAAAAKQIARGNNAYKHYNYLKYTMTRLEKYPGVPLDQYKMIFNALKLHITDKAMLNEICRTNLNLKLTNTLDSLDNNKANLPTCPNKKKVKTSIPYSPSQRDAIETEKPLVLVQSGAGTGKSTVVIGRIKHMLANGIKPNDILVLSFTNAAADNVTERIDKMPEMRKQRGHINSMTIATWLHSIYSYNYPNQSLSTLGTIDNSLKIQYGNRPPAKVSEFSRIVRNLSSDSNYYSQASNYIEDNIDDVVEILETIGQTSLELENIICCIQMNSLTVPAELMTQHLLIDEVQDNSISEFIYSIKYTDLNSCSMYVVGDCSQTLYEFRGSNPKALNALEASGIFTAYKLETNYRSNQEILDFANVMLGDIDANKYANIKLHANDLTPVSLATFTDSVKVAYKKLQNRKNMEEEYALMIKNTLKPYIDEKIANGEQVCFLAYHRRTVNAIEDILKKVYPSGVKIEKNIPIRVTDNTIFSKFAAYQWDRMTAASINHGLMNELRDAMYDRIDYVVPGYDMMKKKDILRRLLDKFREKYGSDVKDLEKKMTNGTLSSHDALEELRKMMLAFERDENALNHATISAKNANHKLEANKAKTLSGADIILSTIHSAKGLEYDNCIVFCETSGNFIDEDDKRMYYVAFTRAKKSEYIVCFDTLVTPKFLKNYQDITTKLKKNAVKAGIVDENDDIDTMLKKIRKADKKAVALNLDDNVQEEDTKIA